MKDKPDYIKLILIVAIVVLAVLLFRRCNTVPKPEYIPIETQVAKVERDEAAMKKQADSFNTVINTQQLENENLYEDYIELVNENSKLQADIMSVSSVVPDTCKKYVAQYKRYVDQTNKTLSTSNSLISGLRNTVSIQDKFLSAKDSAYARLKTSWDTCISTARKLEDYSNTVKPKREISFGVSGMATYSGFSVPGIGVQVGYRNRKGLEITAAVYSNQIITVGIKKSIFKF